MKFTLSWLKDHLETDASIDDITYALTDLGLEVEGVEDRGAKLADFTIGKVVSAEKHPDADRLRVCQVDTDEGMKQIICGAPNAREGITVVVAKPGVYVPGLDITIGVGKIRGIESFGMMASEHEMELSDEHDGIIELENGEVGQANSLSVVSLEHKLGLHGSPTAVMQYDAAIGWLIGEPNKGMAAMFTMMNNARLGVGMQGVSIAEAATQHAIA